MHAISLIHKTEIFLSNVPHQVLGSSVFKFIRIQ